MTHDASEATVRAQVQSTSVVNRQFPIEVRENIDEPFVSTLVAWAILSAAYSAEDEATVEFLDPKQVANVVQIRFHIDTARMTIQDVFDRVRDTLAGVSHNEVSATEMINAVRDNSANLILPPTLIVQSLDAAAQSFIKQGRYSVALAVQTSATGKGGLLLDLCYNKEQAGSDLEYLHFRVEKLLSQLHGQSEKKIGELDLLTTFDRDYLKTLNEPMPEAVHELVYEVIDAQARLYPQNEAVCAWDGSFTYEELTKCVIHLSKNLVQRGVTVGSWVPLLLGKSKWHVVAMLAILRSGAAFVALDVTMPKGRIANVLKQLDSLPLALVSESEQDKLHGLVDQVLVFEESLTTLDDPDTVLPVAGVQGGIQYDQAAYVIFTSGSTGVPKGAVMEHRNLSTSIKALNKEISATTALRSFQLTVLNLDFCISEIFCPLFCGGCVCIPSEWSRYNDIAGAVDSLDANLMSLSPTLLSTMKVTDFPKLTSILLAGERVWKELTEPWSKAGKRALQMYGPTECTVGCCFLDPDVTPHYNGRIGSPYASKFWIVDPRDSNRLMPVGATGEILIEGPVVGRCYLGDPDKTREIFIDPPRWFSSVCERKPIRFYKTGDLGRLSKNGDYEIVGRKDSQVKIRGWRIEVLEVEHQIRMACGGNIGVAVEVRNPSRVLGQEMLVAFLELKNQRDHEGTTTAIEIMWDEIASTETPFSKMIEKAKVTIQQYLPDYMMPSAYVPIRTFPMTNIFKLNRRVLRETVNSLSLADLLSSGSESRSIGESNTLSGNERQLRDIWAEALNLDPNTIGIKDDFFVLGGDSLKAMAVVSAARRQGIHLSVAKLYRHRNVADVSENTGVEKSHQQQEKPLSLLDEANAGQILRLASNQCNVDQDMIQDIMPLTDMQHFFVSSQVKQPHSWRNTISLDLPANVAVEKVQKAWEQLTSHYPILRTRFINIRLGLFQVVLKSETVRWCHGPEWSDVKQQLHASFGGFGSLPHATAILNKGDGSPIQLIWYANHGLLDHLMLELLSQDLAILCGEEALPLPQRPDFKQVIQHRFSYDKAEYQSFWRKHLHGAQYKALFREDQINDKLANRKLSRQAPLIIPDGIKVSGYAVAITALSLALARLTSAADIGLTLTKSGRISTMPGSEDVVGPMIARAPLRVCIRREQLVKDVLLNVHQDFEQANKHEVMRPEDFEEAAPEAVEHGKYGTTLNFPPVDSDLALGSDVMFPVNSEFLEGLHERNRIFGLVATLFRGNLTMYALFDDEILSCDVIQGLLDDWAAALHTLSNLDDKATFESVLSA